MTYQSIRYKHHYGNVLITASGQSNTNSLTGSTVAALLRNGNQTRRPFGGFVDVTHVAGLQRVKLIEVQALYESELGIGPHYAVPSHHYVVGVLINNQFCIALYNGQPKHFPLSDDGSPKKQGSVTRIY